MRRLTLDAALALGLVMPVMLLSCMLGVIASSLQGSQVVYCVRVGCTIQERIPVRMIPHPAPGPALH